MMKKLLMLISILFVSSSLLVACNDDADEGNRSEEPTNTEEENDNVEDNQGEDPEEEEENSTSSEGPTDIETGDQLDLRVGDTGTFDTTLGTYDVTVDDASLVDELDGKYPQFDAFIILDLTIKNTSAHALDLDDLIISMEVSNLVDGSGFSDSSGGFDSIDMLTGAIEPGEEISGDFVTEVYDVDTSEEYYFKKNAGNIAGGSSNQVIWTITTEEAK